MTSQQGCGKGYDVVMLALHGFDVYGLEVSEIGFEAAKKYAQAELGQPSESNFGEATERPTPGKANYIAGDFFSKDWESQLEFQDFEGFDLIYDYTVGSPISHNGH